MLSRLLSGLALVAALLLTGCSDEPDPVATSREPANEANGDNSGAADTGNPVPGRWYSAAQRELGATVFAENCAECHGDGAQGTTEDWRERLADGSLPPPPLNGSAHAWHHPLPVLLQVINNGGAPFGGNMPAFQSVLSEEEKLGAIAYFQSFWSDEIYEQWQQMGGTN